MQARPRSRRRGPSASPRPLPEQGRECSAASSSAGWMREVPGGVRGRLGQLDLGEEHLAAPPGGAQALEGGAVVDPELGGLLVEALDPERLRAGRRPLAEALRGLRGPRGRGRRRRGASTPASPRLRARGGSGSPALAVCPSSSRAPTLTCSCTAPRSGRTSGASIVSSLDRRGRRPARLPAGPAPRRRCRAGSRRRGGRGRPARGGWPGRGAR